MDRALDDVVTVLVGDLQGRTSLGDRVEAATLRRVMARHLGTLCQVVEAHGGRVDRFIGDALIGVFGAGEDASEGGLAAVHAARELQRALAELNGRLDRDWGVEVTARIGVGTGHAAVPDDAGTTAVLTGEAVELASRLVTVSEEGEVLIGDRTNELVRHAVATEPARVAGDAGEAPLPAWRLGRRPAAGPLLGRDAELAQLTHAFERAAARSTVHALTVVGTAGMGKSRLARELAVAVEERATVLTGRCLPYGSGITFWPLAQMVRAATGELGLTGIEALLGDARDSGAVAGRIAQAIGVTDGRAGAAEETSWAVRRLLEALARERPVLLILDDLHWAELPFLDLVEHLAERLRGSPVLLVCLARPELLELRPRWLGGTLNAGAMLLEPLSEVESAVLIDRLLGGGPLADATRGKVLAATRGNPLFVEQMVALMGDTGDREPESVPSTIELLLAARLARLGQSERSLIQRAAVVGEEFSPTAVAALGPEDNRGLEAHLEALVARDLIHPERRSGAAEGAYRFRHILIRDAAYAAIPKPELASLHHRLADWIQATDSPQLTEREEILGYHLEQAYRHAVELGSTGDSLDGIGRAAAARLAWAGGRATEREDMAAAASLLSRAARILPDDSGRVHLSLALGEALECTGRHSEALRVISDGIELARAAEDRGGLANLLVRRAGVQFLMEPERSGRDLLRDAEDAVAMLEELDDWRGLADAWRLIGNVRFLECRAAEAEAAFERALAYAERTPSLRTQALIGADLGRCLLEGPTPLEAGIEFGERWLTLAQAKGASNTIVILPRASACSKFGGRIMKSSTGDPLGSR